MIMFTLIKLTFNCFSMFICRALTLRWLCGWKLLELQFVAEQITSLHFLDSLNSSRLVGRMMFFRNVTASAFGSTYLICEVTKVDYFELMFKSSFVFTTIDVMTDRLTGRLTVWLTDWLTVWQTDWLVNWLVGWLDDQLTDWLPGWQTDWLTGWLIGWLTGWLIGWLADRVTEWLTDWLTNWLTDWLTG